MGLAAEKLAPRLTVREARQRMYRDLLLEAAEREFAERGFAETKVQNIAATADVSLATLYNTFAGKDEIYDAVHQRRMSELVTLATAAQIGQRSPFERLLAGVGALVRYFASHPNYLRMHLRDGISWASVSGITHRPAVESWQVGIRMLVEVVNTAAAAGELAPMPALLQARLIVATLQTWLSDWLESGAKQAPEVVAHELTGYLRQSFARAAAKRKRR